MIKKLIKNSLFIIATITFTAYSSISQACDCPDTTPQEALKWAKQIFVGRIIAGHEVVEDRVYYEDPTYHVLTAESFVDENNRKTWKKVIKKESHVKVNFEVLEIFIGTSPATRDDYVMTLSDCGLPAIIQGLYLVYVGENGIIDKCTGSKSLDLRFWREDQDVNELRQLTTK